MSDFGRLIDTVSQLSEEYRLESQRSGISSIDTSTLSLDFETLMQQLENAEGYDMVHGIHAFEFKDVPGLESMNVLEAFLHVMENRILDDPHGGLQPPHLSPEYFDWARRREAKLQQPKLSRSFSQFENRKITDTSRIPLTRGNEGEDRMWAIKRNQQSKRW